MPHSADATEADPAVPDPHAELVARLSRPHASGGVVIERAAILASGANAATVMRWIADRGGEPEALPASPSAGGLHGERGQGSPAERRPLRYILPPGAVT